MTYIKKLSLIVVGLGLITLGVGSSIQAAETHNIAVTVTVDVVSVSVASNTWAIGQVSPNSANISDSIGVTNDGNRQEDYRLSLAYAGSWTVNNSSGVATDKFALLGLFTGSTPVDADFGADGATDDVITSGLSTASSTQFAISADPLGDKGYDNAAAAVRSLKLNFRAPSANTVPAQQSITVTVTAIAG